MKWPRLEQCFAAHPQDAMMMQAVPIPDYRIVSVARSSYIENHRYHHNRSPLDYTIYPTQQQHKSRRETLLLFYSIDVKLSFDNEGSSTDTLLDRFAALLSFLHNNHHNNHHNKNNKDIDDNKISTS
jgi:hypothetical protein